ncbi:MAG: type-F conjugative transfer system secretin TraK [Sphingobacteriia bacterium]|nr:type-F conjugative transfer system secretin TraK [Sphingobacteriia bacterium]
MRKYFYFILSLFFPLIGDANQNIVINENERINVVIPTNHLTRIYFKNDRIKNLFSNAEDLILEADENLGQLYIRPASSLIKETSITLVSEMGIVQDVNIKVNDNLNLGETVQLISNKPNLMAEIEDKTKTLNYTDDIVSIIKDLIKSDNIKGLSASLVLDKSITLTKISEINKEKYKGEKFKVKNISKELKIITENTIPTNSKILAIAILKKELKPNEVTEAYIVRAK